MSNLTLWYDREGDYLEVLFEDVAAEMEEIADDVFERRTADGRVVGLAVFEFSRYDRDPLTLPQSVKAIAS